MLLNNVLRKCQSEHYEKKSLLKICQKFWEQTLAQFRECEFNYTVVIMKKKIEALILD